jgi:pimeloyl-ACP methyl ester carboxylesterase
MSLNRRQIVRAAALGSSVAIAAQSTRSKAAFAALPENLFEPVPLLAQAPAKEGRASVSGTNLFYWDTGGDGPVVVLMHPVSGSALVWGYQQPALAAAGFRVIAYSRRGHFGSDSADKTNGGVASEDLGALMDFLGVGKFSLIAAAAGCTVTLDFAISHSDRLYAAIFSGGSFSGIDEPDYIAVAKRVIPKGFDDTPPEFRELGPSYRAANPKGLEAWIQLEHKAIAGNRLGARNANAMNWSSVGKIGTRTLFLAGAADLYAPPAQMRLVAGHVPGSEMIIFPECGHSLHWEQPRLFNRTVVEFLNRHAR